MDTFQTVGRYNDEVEADTASYKLVAKWPYVELAALSPQAPHSVYIRKHPGISSFRSLAKNNSMSSCEELEFSCSTFPSSKPDSGQKELCLRTRCLVLFWQVSRLEPTWQLTVRLCLECFDALGRLAWPPIISKIRFQQSQVAPQYHNCHTDRSSLAFHCFVVQHSGFIHM